MKTFKLRKILSDNVKYYRFKKGYTQEQLAEKAEVSARYMSDIENCKGNVPVDTIQRLAECLDVDYYLLLKEGKRRPLLRRVNLKK